MGLTILLPLQVLLWIFLYCLCYYLGSWLAVHSVQPPHHVDCTVVWSNGPNFNHLRALWSREICMWWRWPYYSIPNLSIHPQHVQLHQQLFFRQSCASQDVGNIATQEIYCEHGTTKWYYSYHYNIYFVSIIIIHPTKRVQDIKNNKLKIEIFAIKSDSAKTKTLYNRWPVSTL